MVFRIYLFQHIKSVRLAVELKMSVFQIPLVILSKILIEIQHVKKSTQIMSAQLNGVVLQSEHPHDKKHH